MAEGDPHATQQNLGSGIAGELRNAGFDDVEEVGRGGFGIVYRCTQPELDRTVAVKVLTSDLDPDNLDRLLREQRAMGRLSGHPHIVTILQVGATASGRPLIVMPYHANSLEALIRRHGPLDWGEAVSVGVKLAGALEAAHLVGTLHRGKHPAERLWRTAAHRLRHRQDHRRLPDVHGSDHRFTGVHRAGGTRGRDADTPIGCIFSRRDSVLRDDGPRSLRAPLGKRW